MGPDEPEVYETIPEPLDVLDTLDILDILDDFYIESNYYDS